MKKEPFKDSEVTFRLLTEADLPLLGEWLMDPVVLNWFPMSNGREVEDAVKIWQTFAKQSLAYTVEVNHKPAGMAILYVNNFEKLKEQALFAILVNEHYRGRGVGGKFLKYLIHSAKNLGVKLLHLEVYEGNPAYNLYTRHGFKEYGRHKKFLRDASGAYHTKVMMQLYL
ncbi:MAG: GNAT family N-acetyltransferase [Verrucomicrobia bacterium]|nr:GNAT family N-acetyltransferase [Verrucomicrobiota bacterium]